MKMESFPKPDKKPTNKLRNLVMAVTAVGLIGHSAKAQDNKKESLNDSTKTEQTIKSKEKIVSEDYITRDGNYRYYHNAATPFYNGDPRIDYSLGATKCPFETEEEIKTKTRIPESVTETDFFVNYVNSKYEPKSHKILEDKNTGNQYYDFSEFDSTLDNVPFEGDKHWNIQRFIIAPEYLNFYITKDEARRNTLFDMYKYFLYQEKGERNIAWEKANNFVVENIDTIVNSEYAKWANENYPKIFPYYEDQKRDSNYFFSDMNLYDGLNETSLPKDILNYNFQVLNGEKQGKLYSAKEIEDILVNYNITYRKKDPETAKQIAHQSIIEADAQYRQAEEEIKNKPISKYFSEEDRKRKLEKFKKYRFAE